MSSVRDFRPTSECNCCRRYPAVWRMLRIDNSDPNHYVFHHSQCGDEQIRRNLHPIIIETGHCARTTHNTTRITHLASGYTLTKRCVNSFRSCKFPHMCGRTSKPNAPQQRKHRASTYRFSIFRSQRNTFASDQQSSSPPFHNGGGGDGLRRVKTIVKFGTFR